MSDYYVYILASPSRTLYVGVTNDLTRRVYEHRNKFVDGFTRQYNVTMLVYYETTPNVESAIMREKQIKGLLRRRKIELIESVNSEWRDLGDDLLD
jgi:putative endonuclease